jgi:hypothetical protein
MPMPLRDHFNPPVSRRTSWDALHGMWPAFIVQDLFGRLPPGYVAEPHIHLGRDFEIDVASWHTDEGLLVSAPDTNGIEGGVAVWAPARPPLCVEADLADFDEYEVRVYNTERDRQLVAAIEIVGPANKDRPEHRQIFVAKCAALLRQRVAVVIVDLITPRHFNLYADLLSLIERTDPSLETPPPALYAVAARWSDKGRMNVLETWVHPLVLGQPLPTLPLWLTEKLAIRLDLEKTYEEVCRILHLT